MTWSLLIYISVLIGSNIKYISYSYDYQAKNLIDCQKIAEYINDPASPIKDFYHEIKADCVLKDVNDVYPKYLKNSFNQPVERLSIEQFKKILNM